VNEDTICNTLNREYNEGMRYLADATDEESILVRKPTPIKVDDHTVHHIWDECKKSGSVAPFNYDKDNLCHINIIIAIADIRCKCFGIPFVDRSVNRIQTISGHITPSLVTTSVCASSTMLMQLDNIAAGSRLYNGSGNIKGCNILTTSINNNGYEVPTITVDGKISAEEFGKYVSRNMLDSLYVTDNKTIWNIIRNGRYCVNKEVTIATITGLEKERKVRIVYKRIGNKKLFFVKCKIT
jgi:hypothetical protein